MRKSLRDFFFSVFFSYNFGTKCVARIHRSRKIPAINGEALRWTSQIHAKYFIGLAKKESKKESQNEN
jgi:hypothetical protein